MHDRHPHAGFAHKWFRQRTATDTFEVNRVVQMGALRVLTNRSAMQVEVLTPDDFWRLWDTLLTDTRVTFVAEPPNLDETWRALTLALPQGRKADTDTYLAAFAMASGASLVTFDKGFSRYEGLDLQLIAPA